MIRDLWVRLLIFALALCAAVAIWHLPGPAFGAQIDRKLARCFVYLPDMTDARLRRWCLARSRKMP